MKRLMMLAAALMGFATVTQAQIDYPAPIYGITAGINFANMAKNEGGDALVRTNAGVFGGYRFGKFLSVEGALLYSGGGTSMYVANIDKQEINDVVHLNLNYLDIPIIARFYAVKGLNLHAGAQVGFLVRKRFNYRGDKYEVNDKLDFNTIDAAIPMGIGYDFGKFRLDVRYTLGLVDVIKNDEVTTHNNQLNLNLAYIF